MAGLLISDTLNNRTIQSGVARYFERIRAGLIAQYGSQVTICSPECARYGLARWIRTPAGLPDKPRLAVHDLITSGMAAWLRPRVFFSPYFGNARTRAAQVFTVYDMILELFPQYYPVEQRSIRHKTPAEIIDEKQRCLERAEAVLCISQSTANDILNFYPHISSSRLHVIHLGVDPVFFEVTPTATRQQKPYFIFVGKRRSYKNFRLLLEALGLSGLGADFDLLVVGSSNLTNDEQRLTQQYALSLRFIAGVTDTELHDLYRDAVALVFPSEYEGFGLPVLEAMASGTLVVYANTSSLPELTGGLGFHFDPNSLDGMIDALQKAAEIDGSTRQTHTAQLTQQARQFTWDACQQKTLAVIASLNEGAQGV